MAKINFEQIEPALWRAWVDGRPETEQVGLTGSSAIGEVMKSAQSQLGIIVEQVPKGSYDAAKKG